MNQREGENSLNDATCHGCQNPPEFDMLYDCFICSIDNNRPKYCFTCMEKHMNKSHNNQAAPSDHRDFVKYTNVY